MGTSSLLEFACQPVPDTSTFDHPSLDIVADEYGFCGQVGLGDEVGAAGCIGHAFGFHPTLRYHVGPLLYFGGAPLRALRVTARSKFI